MQCTSRGSVAVRIVAKTRTVDRDRLSEFVDLGEAYQRVKKFATENQFFDLPRDEQMSAVAFILIVERGPVESSLKDFEISIVYVYGLARKTTYNLH